MYYAKSTLRAPSTAAYFILKNFFFLIYCQADDSHKISSLIFYKNEEKDFKNVVC